ncbi:MAG: hypothetical protein WD669_11755 [Pirellulales bacterium]
MATESSSVADSLNSSGAVIALTSRAWTRLEALLVRAGDWLNPILVKETRQALKSRQFVVTFVLVLAACWIVTIIGVAAMWPAIRYSAAGGALLFWYYVILAFPLTIVVPYAAFRSLAAEREDNTYELLSITTLKPRQIISGKLGSSIAQMAIFFSAVTPCLAFTYLLRGVDLPTIAILLVYSFFGSLGLSMVGLLLATLSRQRYGQIFISVVFVAGLLGAFILGLYAAAALISLGYAYFDGGLGAFWIVTWALFTAFVTIFALLYYAAAGMITFTSENRSTPLRITMLIQQACWIGWMGYGWVSNINDSNSFVVAMVIFAGVYWYFMGILLTSERPKMSQRIKRQLPKSFLGRVFLTWFNPGPASGYLFVVANASAIAVMALLALGAAALTGRMPAGRPSDEQIVYLTFVGWGYLVVYLGVGLLLISALRRVATVSMMAGVLVQLLLLIGGSGIPWTLQMMSSDLRELDYSFLQITNPFWTITHLAARGLPLDARMLLLIVSAAAICVLLLNLPGVIRELREVRIALPARVAEDELALHPLPAPEPTNPWDEERLRVES